MINIFVTIYRLHVLIVLQKTKSESDVNLKWISPEENIKFPIPSHRPFDEKRGNYDSEKRNLS
jgi:hypothetical protein